MVEGVLVLHMQAAVCSTQQHPQLPVEVPNTKEMYTYSTICTPNIPSFLKTRRQ